MKSSKRLSRRTSLLSLLSLVVLLSNLLALTAWWGRFSRQSFSTISEKKAEMVSNDLLKLAHAMAEFEGWRGADEIGAGQNHASVSWRNHNPGNLRKSPWAIGECDGFAVFLNDEVGFHALVWDLHQKATGNTVTGLNGRSTVYQLIKIYSGEPEATVLNYATFIENRTGIKMTATLGELVGVR